MPNSVRFVGTFEDGISRKLKDVSNGFDKLGGKGSGASLFGNVGAKLVAGGFGLIEEGATVVIDKLFETVDISEKVESQEKQLDAALRAHGDSLANERAALEASITTGEKYGFTADDTRAAVTRLSQAGLKFTDIQRGLPAVLDLARAKHISVADAADIMAKATTGNARGLADLGIKLTPASGKMTDLAKATDQAKAKGDNFLTVANAITGATGDQADSVTDLQKKQVLMNDKWEAFATKIGPGVSTILGAIIDALSWLTDRISTLLDLLDQATKPQAGSHESSGAILNPNHHASGGWAGLNGPELSWLGEDEPELVIPRSRLQQSAGTGMTYVAVPMTAEQLADAAERGLYLSLSRQPALAGSRS